MQRPHVLLAVLTLVFMAPAADAEEDSDSLRDHLPPGCLSTTDYPPSHIWCDLDVARVDCHHGSGWGYRCA